MAVITIEGAEQFHPVNPAGALDLACGDVGAVDDVLVRQQQKAALDAMDPKSSVSLRRCRVARWFCRPTGARNDPSLTHHHYDVGVCAR
jgi:hypothetical protein